MGSGYYYHCEKCGAYYDVSVGVGMAFPEVYRQAVKGVLEGAYGREWQEAARGIEHFAVDAELRLYRCDDCGGWEVDYGMSLYAPKDVAKLMKKQFGEKTVAEWGHVPYVMEDDLRKDYDLIKERVHSCEKCGKPMSVVDVESEDAPALKCPECGGDLSNSGLCMCWD